MNAEFDKMAALAEELIAYNDALQTEVNQLRKQQKTASEARPAPVVSEECIASTCEALKQAGLIDASQVAQTKRAFAEDPEAIHRTVKGILDAQSQAKTAAAEVDLSGGTCVNGARKAEDVYEDSMDRIQSILGIRY